MAGGRGGELSSFDTNDDDDEEVVVLKQEEEDLEDRGGRGRNSFRERLNKIVQTTARNSWSLVRHFKSGGGTARSA